MPNLGNYYPYELVFMVKRPKILINIKTDLDIKVSGAYKDYHTLLLKKARLSAKHAAEFQNEMASTFKQGQGIFPI